MLAGTNEQFAFHEKLHESQHTLVFRAVESSTKQGVIVKIAKDTRIHPSIRERLECEKFWLDVLKYDDQSRSELVETEFGLGLVMADRGLTSFKQYLAGRALDAEEFLALAISLTEALKTLHDANVIHSDINLNNVLIANDATHLELIDFDLTHSCEAHVEYKQANLLLGTLSHMAPEKTGRINKPITQASDLYSLGVCFYEMLTACLPFEGETAAELVYAHLAKQAKPMSEVAAVSDCLDQLVFKLLEKSPENRYESAEALLVDLNSLKGVGDLGSLDDFVPNASWRRVLLRTPNQLYGRKEDRTSLMQSFELSLSRHQVAVIKGLSGIGKTALVETLYLPMTKQDAFFLRGKFDQRYATADSALGVKVNASSSLSGFRDVLLDLVQHIDALDAGERERYITALQTELEGLGQVLVDLVPEFGALLGPQPALMELSYTESVARRDYLATKTIRTVCKLGRPVVLFLDDLQWIDEASKSLLEQQLSLGQGNLMTILSYREDEIGKAHLIRRELDELEASRQNVLTMSLGVLDNTALGEWCEDLLSQQGYVGDARAQNTLVRELMLRTGGNPYHIQSLMTLLIDKKILHLDSRNKISLEHDEVLSLPVDSLLEHLERRIRTLPADAIHAFSCASVLGNRFSRQQLRKLLDLDLAQSHDMIRLLVDARLFLVHGEQLSFVHDKVQESAIKSLSPDLSRRLNKVAGLDARQSFIYKTHFDENPLVVINHNDYLDYLNLVVEDLTDKVSALELCHANLSHGRYLKSNGSVDAAFSYLQLAKELMPQDCFDSNYDLARQIHVSYGELCMNKKLYEEADEIYNQVLVHATSPLDISEVVGFQVKHYALISNSEKAMGLVIQALAGLGVNISPKPLKLMTLYHWFRINRLLDDFDVEEILNLPMCTDPKVDAIMQLTGAAIYPIYRGFPEYFPTNVCLALEYTLKNGITSNSPNCMVGFAAVCCLMGKVERGIQIAKVAKKLMGRLPLQSSRGHFYLQYGGLLHYWFEPLPSSAKESHIAVDCRHTCGDFDSAAFSIGTYSMYEFHGGIPVKEILESLEQRHSIVVELGREGFIRRFGFFRQFLSQLSDPYADPRCISGVYSDQETLIKLSDESSDYTTRFLSYADMGTYYYLGGQFDLAIKYLRIGQEFVKHTPGVFYSVVYAFLTVLTLVRLAQDRGKFTLSEHGEIRRAKKEIKVWGEKGAINFASLLTLSNAELQSFTQVTSSSLKLYEQAVNEAKSGDQRLYQGLALECMGRAYERLGLQSEASYRYQEAIKIYEDFDASFVSNRLRTEVGEEWGEKQTQMTVAPAVLDPLSNTNVTNLDLDALVKSIELLTQELSSIALYSKTLQLIVQNSGATKAVFFRKRDDRLEIQTYCRGDEVVTALNQQELRASLSNDCDLIESARNQNDVVRMSSNEEHRSVLLMPIAKGTQQWGLIYLENNLISDAFHAEQEEFLRLLSNQALISIENVEYFERVNAEREYSEQLISKSPVMICGLTPDGRVSFCNVAVVEITGYKEADILEQNFLNLLLCPEHHCDHATIYQQIRSKGVRNLELVLRDKGGESCETLWTSFTVLDEAQGVESQVLFGMDVREQNKARRLIVNYNEELSSQVVLRTQELADANSTLNNTIVELNEAQDLLVETEKMAALGNLVAGVAHEINTPLGVSLTAITQMMNDISDLQEQSAQGASEPKKVDKFLARSNRVTELIFKNLQKTAKLVTNFKQIALKQSQEDKRQFDLDELLKKIAMSFTSQLEENDLNFHVESEYSKSLFADPNLFGQIFTQLINNTLHHGFPEPKEPGNERAITIKVWGDDTHLRIQYRDTGVGIPSDVQGRIFEPFFTTNRKFGGAGLGLNVAYNIVHQELKGVLFLEALDDGCGFRMDIPKLSLQA